jgi:WS/DGAT/MGAT family acyltransferase
VSLPAPGTERQLYDLATSWYEDPYDRTRPLWMFVIVDGLDGGRGALFSKMHHSITDGIGALRLSEKYLDLEADAEQPEPVDLDAVIAESLAHEEAAERSADGVSPTDNLRRSLGHVARRQIGRARRAAGEVATWTGDPLLARDFAEDQLAQVRAVLDQLDGDEESRPGSPLWTERSRRRHLETITLSVSELKAAGKELDASINDLFVAGLAMGAIDHHRAHGVTPEGLNASFVVSTRSDAAIGGNSFTPTMLPLAGSYRKPKPYLKDVKKRMAERRDAISGEGALAGFAGVANLLPTSVVTQVARATAGKLDIATSNLRGAPFPTFIAGARVERNITLGPVSGTAMNVTAMSNADVFEIGLVVDPAAVNDPAQLRDHIATAYAELLAAAG